MQAWGWTVLAVGLTIVAAVAIRRRRRLSEDPLAAGRRAIAGSRRDQRHRAKGTLRGKGQGGDNGLAIDSGLGSDSGGTP